MGVKNEWNDQCEEFASCAKTDPVASNYCAQEKAGSPWHQVNYYINPYNARERKNGS